MSIPMRFAIIVFFLFQFSWIHAQQIEVISSADQTPLIGATITLMTMDGATSHITTNIKGIADIQKAHFKGNRQLIITTSYIGYETSYDTIYILDGYKLIQLAPKNHLIDDVVVTAQYSPTSIDKSIHKVNVISSHKIEQMAAVNIKDVLSNELNIRLSEDNILGSRMSMQGMSGQNIKFLIDGIPIIGRFDGQIDLSQINLNNVERIEIIEGPLSANYGSNALAGTINIITKKKTNEKLNISAESYSENIGTFNFETQAAFRLAKNHSLQLTLGRNFFDGWSPEDDFFPSFKANLADSSRSKQWHAKTQHFGRMQYHFNYKEILFSYKGELFQETISNLGYPRRTLTSYTAFDDFYHTKRLDNAIFAKGKLNSRWSIDALMAYNDFKRIKESRIKDLVTLESKLRPENLGEDIQDTSLFDLLTSRASISSTKDSSWINYEIGYDINLESAKGERIEGDNQHIGDYAIFASAELSLINDFVIKPAVRYSYNTEYKAPVTPSINIRYGIKNSIFRLSYAKGFRAPTLKELYFNFNDANHSLFGNADLKAEQSNNYSASMQQKFVLNNMLLKADAILFYNQIYDQINFAQSSQNGGDTLVYFNVGKNQTKGINLNLSTFYHNFQFNVGGSYIGIYNQLSEEVASDRYAYSAEVKGSASYLFKKPQLTVSVFAKHQGALPAFAYDTNDVVVKQTIESFQLIDLTIGKTFWNERLKVAVGCKNILNVTNINSNVSTGAHSGGGGSVPMATGRTLFVKLGVNFNKK